MKTLSLQDVSAGRYTGRRDFVVSGKSLLREVTSLGFDLVPRIAGGSVAVDQDMRAVLLAEKPGDTESGRVALYVCPCGDYGCGVVSARIDREGDDIVWSDFVYENTLPETAPIPLEKLGPFRFDGDDYAKAVGANV